jgi:hypothetical protein
VGKAHVEPIKARHGGAVKTHCARAVATRRCDSSVEQVGQGVPPGGVLAVQAPSIVRRLVKESLFFAPARCKSLAQSAPSAQLMT